MKILLINNCHYRRGGADIVYFNTAGLLKRQGHEVFFFSSDHPDNISDECAKYFTTYRDYRKLPFWGKVGAMPSFIYNREAYKKLLIMIDDIKPDIAHIHLFLGGLSISILKALKKRNVPIIHTVHDYRLICPAYTFLDRRSNICELCKDKFYLRCAFKKCSLENNLSHSIMLSLDAYYRRFFINPVLNIDKFIFVSNFSKNKHIEFNPSLASKSKVIYNFSNVENNTEKINRGKYFLYYGRLSREKGLINLIDTFKNFDGLLLIAGRGPLLDQYRDQKFDNIQFLGFKSGKELWDIVRNASFVILPSEWYENNPLTIIESFSLGKPVIGADIGGIPELINNENGFLFKASDSESLSEILKKAQSITDEEYHRMSLSVKDFAHKHFSEEAHFEELLNIYKSVIHDKKNNKQDNS